MGRESERGKIQRQRERGVIEKREGKTQNQVQKGQRDRARECKI